MNRPPNATLGPRCPNVAINRIPDFRNSSSYTTFSAHGDWTVTCAQRQTDKLCAFSQQQLDNKTRQRVLGIELAVPETGKAQGTLALPFGLLLKSGAILQIDDGKPAAPLSFRTCLPGGCLVSLTIDEKTLALLREGTALKVTATAADSGKPVTFTISLKGFDGALARTVELSK